MQTFLIVCLILAAVGFLVSAAISSLDDKQTRGCLHLFLAVVAVIGCFAVRDVYRRREVRAFGQPVLSLCDLATTDGPMPSIDPPVRFLALSDDSAARLEFHPWHRKLPRRWRARNEDELDFVLCVSQQDVEIQSCLYTFGSLSTYRIDYEVAVVDPESAKVVLRHTLRGTAPEPCPAEKSASQVALYGEAPKYRTFEDWLRQQAAFGLSD